MSKIYLEILDKKRQQIFNKLSNFKKQGYLAGGTSLALQLKHRKSVDFDVFVNKQINNLFKKQIYSVFGTVNYSVDSSDQITFTVDNAINLTFVWYYYSPIQPLVVTHSLPLSSVKDIVADKAHTIGRRAIWRDYVDLFWIIKNNIVILSDIINLAKKKFKGEFIETQFLEQLCYFDDVAITPIEFISKSYSSRVIKSFLEKEVDDYLKKTLALK